MKDLVNQLMGTLPALWQCCMGWTTATLLPTELSYILANPYLKKTLQKDLGRKAGFQAINSFLASGGTLTKPWNIEYHPNGRPYLINNQAVDVSISHSSNFAVAALCNQGRVGIDIEHLKPSSKEFMDFFLDEQEIKILSRIHTAWYPSLGWSMKEAVIKLLGIGLSGNQNNVKIEEVIHESIALISFKPKILDQAIPNWHYGSTSSCHVHFTFNSEYGLALAVVKGDPFII